MVGIIYYMYVTRTNLDIHVHIHVYVQMHPFMCTANIVYYVHTLYICTQLSFSFSLSLSTANYIEVVTSPDPSQRGAQLSLMFSCPIEKVSKAIQAKGAAVSTCLSLLGHYS